MFQCLSGTGPIDLFSLGIGRFLIVFDCTERMPLASSSWCLDQGLGYELLFPKASAKVGFCTPWKLSA